MPTLTIQLPGLPPVDHILRDEMMTIGRMKGNTIALDETSVSVSHAKITHKNGEFFLKDLNSTNGTMLNGQSINEARLRDGDQLKFGEVIAYYHSEPAFVSTTPVSTPAAAPVPALAIHSVPPPPPAPAASATFSSPSTSFVSKRLVSQAAPATQAPLAPGSRPMRGSKQKRSLVMPVLGGALALAAAGVLGWLLFRENADNRQTTPAPNPGAMVKKTVSENPTAATASKQIQPTAPAPKTPAADPNENQSLPDLRKALKAADPAGRRRAAAALHALGTNARDAVPELRLALNDSDADVRMWAALALINNKSYDKATIPILVQVLRNDNPTLRQVACLSLALIPYDEAEKQTVLTALVETANKDADEEVRKTALSALKIISPDLSVGGK